ncbi:hypothetical protein COP1_003073 [Malus domestica]
MNGFSRAFGLNLEEPVMNRSSRAFGLNLEEQLDVCGFVDVVDPKGRWGLILDERMMNDGAFFKGHRGLILNWWKFFKGLWGLILNWWMVDRRAVGA